MKHNATRNQKLYHYEAPRTDRGWYFILPIAVMIVASMALSSCQGGESVNGFDVAVVGE